MSNLRTSGVIRKIDELGRICLPMELRKKLNIKTGDDIDITELNGTVHLNPIRTACVECGATDKLVELLNSGLLLCEQCFNEALADK